MRTKNEAANVAATLTGLRAQTLPVEIVVVDSGSEDATVEIASRWADRLLEIPADSYTPGRSLNTGAAACAGEIHVAFSAHCTLPDPEWLERSVAHYANAEVAATNGTPTDPDGRPIVGVFLQRREHIGSDPLWGFSNHASTWRADVWRAHPFDESIPITGEDRAWSWEVIEAGHAIAFDPTLWVDMSHRWRAGMRTYYRRVRDEQISVSALAPLPRYGIGEMAAEWWSGMSDDGHSRAFHRANPRRAAGLLGTYVGRRRAQR